MGELDVVKIGDFGLAKILQGGRFMVDRESQFPIKWTAPEAATKKEYTTKSDVVCGAAGLTLTAGAHNITRAILRRTNEGPTSLCSFWHARLRGVERCIRALRVARHLIGRA